MSDSIMTELNNGKNNMPEVLVSIHIPKQCLLDYDFLCTGNCVTCHKHVTCAGLKHKLDLTGYDNSEDGDS